MTGSLNVFLTETRDSVPAETEGSLQLRNRRIQGYLRKPARLTTTLLVGMALVFGVGITTQGTASAAIVTCSGVGFQHCLQPNITTLARNTTTCPGSNQWFTGTDSSTNIGWTWANGGNACVRVDYYPVLASNCTYTFYVPDNHASANIIFGYWTSDGVKHYFPALNENPTSGWNTLNAVGSNGFLIPVSNVTRISFQDNDGQTGIQMAWGMSANYGIGQQCG